jgi:hypothetical protein
MADKPNFVQHVEIARQFQPDETVRIEAETTDQVDVGLEMINRAKHPEQCPPEAQLIAPTQRPQQSVIFQF